MKKKKRKTPHELMGKPIEVQIEMSKLNVIPMEFRRSFKAGDIVALKDSKNVPFILKTDEYKAVETDDELLKVDDLVLLCPVENREDRSAAADGSHLRSCGATPGQAGVTREGGAK